MKLDGATISGNTATNGPAIYSGNASIVITVKRGTLNDLDTPSNTWENIIKGKFSAINNI